MLPDLPTRRETNPAGLRSQCTYRCVVLPDGIAGFTLGRASGLNAPTGAWCSLTITVVTVTVILIGLNAPTGAWCSLTPTAKKTAKAAKKSQCTYRCVVLPDCRVQSQDYSLDLVSMHLQVRGAP